MRPIWQKARVLRHQTTDAERKLWAYLKGRQLAGIKFRRQYPIAGYIADFAAPEIRLIVELDGGQHLERGEYDARRSRRIMCNGYCVLRFWNDDVLLRTEDVLAEIMRMIDVTPPQPSPAFAGEGAESEGPT